MAPARKVDREKARRLRREQKMTYAEIAAKLGCSWNSAFYACNPEKRREQTDSEQRRSIYVPPPLWGVLGAESRNARVSRSRLIVEILTGKRPALSEEAE